MWQKIQCIDSRSLVNSKLRSKKFIIIYSITKLLKTKKKRERKNLESSKTNRNLICGGEK